MEYGFKLQTNSGHQGFSVTFENGVTVFVSWAKRDLCDNRYSDEPNKHCMNAEVIILHKGEYVSADLFPDKCPLDHCMGYQFPEDLVEILNVCKAWKPK